MQCQIELERDEKISDEGGVDKDAFVGNLSWQVPFPS